MSVAVVGKQYTKYNYAISKKGRRAKEVGLKVVEEIGDEGTPKKVVKVLKYLFGFLKNVPFTMHDDQKTFSHIKTANDFFGALGIFGNIYALIENIRQKPSLTSKHPRLDKQLNGLKIASNVLGIADGATSFIKLLDAFKVINLAKCSLKLGNIPIFGSIPTVSVGSFFDLIALTKAGVDIGISSIQLHKLIKEGGHIGHKNRYWKDPALSNEFMKKRISHFQQKRTKIEQAKQDLEKTLDVTDQAVQKAQKGKSKLALKKAIHIHNRLVDHHNYLADKVTALDTKIGKWATTQLTPDEINSYKQGKLQKWKVKLANVNLNKWKNGLDIALNVILIISLVSAIVLGILGLATGATLIVLTFSALAITIAKVAASLFKKHAKPKKIPQVDLPKRVIKPIRPRAVSI